jgi:hypothetical protein
MKNIKYAEKFSVINKFPIVNENDVNTANGTHTICKQCVITLKGDLMQMKQQGKITLATKSVPIKCSVCIKKIHEVELRYLKPLLKSETGGCCSIL